MINVSTSGRTWSELEKRADCLALDGDLKPDLASLTLSSLNFLNGPSVNAPEVIIGAWRRSCSTAASCPSWRSSTSGCSTSPTCSHKEGLLPGPVVANLFFGNVAGMQATLPEVGLADRAAPGGAVWSGAGLGDFQLTAQALSVAAGGGVRVGLEDGIFFDRGRTELATNPGLVERVHHLLERPRPPGDDAGRAARATDAHDPSPAPVTVPVPAAAPRGCGTSRRRGPRRDRSSGRRAVGARPAGRGLRARVRRVPRHARRVGVGNGTDALLVAFPPRSRPGARRC